MHACSHSLVLRCSPICQAKCLHLWCPIGKMNSGFCEVTTIMGRTGSMTVSTVMTITTILVGQTTAKTAHGRSLGAAKNVHIPVVAELDVDLHILVSLIWSRSSKLPHYYTLTLASYRKLWLKFIVCPRSKFRKQPSVRPGNVCPVRRTL